MVEHCQGVLLLPEILNLRWPHGRAARSGAIVNARMKQVRYRSHATYSRQPRQVRKEATVTGSYVCSEVPVPDFFPQPRVNCLSTSDCLLLHSFTTFFRRNCASGTSIQERGRDRTPEVSDESSQYFPCLSCDHSCVGKTVSGPFGLSGSIGPFCHRLPIVASAESFRT